MNDDEVVDRIDEELQTYAVTEFHCPVCGGRFFSTDLPKNQGYCTNRMMKKAPGGGLIQSSVPCTFKWDRNDDHKYFRPTGERRPVIERMQAVKFGKSDE